MNLVEMVVQGVKNNNETAIKILRSVLTRTTIGTMTDEEAILFRDLKHEVQTIFHRTTVQVTILSEKPFVATSLVQIAEAITDGNCVGTLETVKEETINSVDTAKALYAAGSEPSFFNLNNDGTPLYDEEDEE